MYILVPTRFLWLLVSMLGSNGQEEMWHWSPIIIWCQVVVCLLWAIGYQNWYIIYIFFKYIYIYTYVGSYYHVLLILDDMFFIKYSRTCFKTEEHQICQDMRKSRLNPIWISVCHPSFDHLPDESRGSWCRQCLRGQTVHSWPFTCRDKCLDIIGCCPRGTVYNLRLWGAIINIRHLRYEFL